MRQTTYPLIDLHLHLDGSLSIASVQKLAALQNIALPAHESELRSLLQVSENCRDLNEYLEKFAFPCSLLQTPEAISEAVYQLQEELQAQGLLYAEIRFAPQLHLLGGMNQMQVVEAAIDGLHRSSFHAGLILCCMRGNGDPAPNLETIRTAARYLGNGVCAVDLAGAEALFPTKDFANLFALAKDLDVPYTIHAGEADGPESVYAALELGARRIGHGVRSLEDPALIRLLAETGIPLELCPTSNLNTNIFADMAQYPLRQLLQAGIRATVNTDNMTVSDTNLAAELEALTAACGLTREEQKTLAHNAANAAFADPKTRAWLLQEIEARFR